LSLAILALSVYFEPESFRTHGGLFLGASSEAYPYGKDWVNNLLDELPETKDVET